ncbi:extracellular solute-binding protein [Streptomyces sp. 7N604]|uniref:extracellular solute-binding protein n=1 Tax=Streptomyces sp. 7N604 TaxID=3457415 RepID=UPI003FCFE9D9
MAAVVALLSAACTSGGDAAPDPGPSPGRERVLRVATASDVSQGPVRQDLIEAWDEQEPDVRVEIVKLPSAADDARSQLVAALQSGSADYDVVNIDVVYTAEFAAGKLIRPLDEGLLDGMWDQVKKTAQYDGRTWAVPFNTDAGLLYYRKDIWKDERRRPPVSWSELESSAVDVKDSRQVKKTFPYGYATQLDAYEGLTVNAQEAIWARGGELIDGEGTVRAGTPETEKGLNDLVDRYEEIMPPQAKWADERDSLEMFRDGKVAFMRNWPYVYNVLSADGSKVEGKFGVAPLPGVGVREKSVLGGQNLAITERSEHPEDARRLLAYLAGPAQQRCLLEAGFAPVLRESYEPGGADCSLPGAKSPGAGGEGGREGSGSPERDADGLPVYTRPLKRALSDASPRPVTPYYAAFTELVQTKVHQMLNDRGDDDGSVAAELGDELKEVVRGR